MGRGTFESAKSALLKRRCAVTTIHSHRSLPPQQGEVPALLGLGVTEPDQPNWGQRQAARRAALAFA
jgi:hypothetical protein